MGIVGRKDRVEQIVDLDFDNADASIRVTRQGGRITTGTRILVQKDYSSTCPRLVLGVVVDRYEG